MLNEEYTRRLVVVVVIVVVVVVSSVVMEVDSTVCLYSTVSESGRHIYGGDETRCGVRRGVVFAECVRSNVRWYL